MTNIKKEILRNRDNYFVNFDYKKFTGLTRKHTAFLVMTSNLNKANVVATNKEYATHLDCTPTYIHEMIDLINSKHPGLIEVEYKHVNHLHKITNNKNHPKARVITLTSDIHTKGEAFLNLPDFVFKNPATFLSSNELQVLGYLSSFKDGSFKGFLSLIIEKLQITYGILKRALEKLRSIKALFKRSVSTLSKLKNIHYQVNTLSINKDWKLDESLKLEVKHIPQKIPQDYEKEDSWDEILKKFGGSF